MYHYRTEMVYVISKEEYIDIMSSRHIV